MNKQDNIVVAATVCANLLAKFGKFKTDEDYMQYLQDMIEYFNNMIESIDKGVQ